MRGVVLSLPKGRKGATYFVYITRQRVHLRMKLKRVCDFLSPVGDDLMVALGNAQILLSLIGTALFWKARIVVTQFLF